MHVTLAMQMLEGECNVKHNGEVGAAGAVGTGMNPHEKVRGRRARRVARVEYQATPCSAYRREDVWVQVA